MKQLKNLHLLKKIGDGFNLRNLNHILSAIHL